MCACACVPMYELNGGKKNKKRQAIGYGGEECAWA